MSCYRKRDRCSGVVVRQWDGTFCPIEACTCEPFFVANRDCYNVFCVIEQHATLARQSTWSFDDNGNLYPDTAPAEG